MKFKTAKQLRMPDEHRDALIKTLELLEASDERKMTLHDGRTIGFNMNWWKRDDHACGTVCCIGGTAEVVGGVDFSALIDREHAVNDLFYPRGLTDNSEWDAITPAEAASVLRKYLETGVINWLPVIDQVKRRVY